MTQQETLQNIYVDQVAKKTTKDQGINTAQTNNPFGFHFLKHMFSPLQNRNPKLQKAPSGGFAEVKFEIPVTQNSESEKSCFATPETRSSSILESRNSKQIDVPSGAIKDLDRSLFNEAMKEEELKTFSDVWRKELEFNERGPYWVKVGYIYSTCKTYKQSNSTLFGAVLLMNQLKAESANNCVVCILLSSSIREFRPLILQEIDSTLSTGKDGIEMNRFRTQGYQLIKSQRKKIPLIFFREFFLKCFAFTSSERDQLEHWLDLLFFDPLIAQRNACYLVLSVIQHFIREERLHHLKDVFSKFIASIKISSERLRNSEAIFLGLKSQASVGEGKSVWFAGWKETKAYNLRTGVRGI
jgi:hypothetical protein